MCGLVGIVAEGSAPIVQELEAMSACVAHRGPDHDAVSVWSGEAANSVGLAFRRLSIIDLSDAASQPMSDPTGRYHLVFNGEIYNYIELREELERLGEVFVTSSDTEVLLRSLIRWGPDALPRLVGMFALAMFDKAARTVFLARDAFGIKPLYFARWSRGLAFSSELAPLLLLPGVRRDVDPEGIHDYLFKGLVDHRDQTLFAAVSQLEPASWVEVDVDKCELSSSRRFWSLDIDSTADVSLQEAGRTLRELLFESVNLHMRSDVPVAAALSGGIDSSGIVMIMRELAGPSADIHAFTYVAKGDPSNEERWADLVAQRAGVVQHKVIATHGDLLDDVEDLVFAQGEPSGSTSIYAQYRVFREVADQGIKVSLDGQGADELFGGYPMYFAARLGAAVRGRRVKEAFRLFRAAGKTPYVTRRRLASHAAYYGAPAWMQRLGLRAIQPDWINKKWFDQRALGRREPWPPRIESLREMLYGDLVRYRIPHLLRNDDRNSMAHSVESRVPYLTPAIAEFVYQLPDEYLIDETALTKPVLREALRGVVADEVLARRDKIGFATPEVTWLRHLEGWVDEVLSSDRARSIGAIDLEAARERWQRVLSGEETDSSLTWRVIHLIRWADQFDVVF